MRDVLVRPNSVPGANCLVSKYIYIPKRLAISTAMYEAKDVCTVTTQPNVRSAGTQRR
jgi:hypothetical protein